MRRAPIHTVNAPKWQPSVETLGAANECSAQWEVGPPIRVLENLADVRADRLDCR